MPRAQKVNSRIEKLEDPWSVKFIEQLDAGELAEFEEEGKVYAHDVASFIDEYWEEITGLAIRDKDQESHFPNEVASIIYDLDVEDFDDAWGSQREGANDWEPECETCGAEMSWEDDENGYTECEDCREDEDDY